MENHVSPAAESQIRALCRQISVAHNLDEEIQAELYSHMEDKLLGYLSGEEELTEEDAFILVREHFGDPAVIRSLLQETHVVEVRVGLWQKFVLFWWAAAGSFALHYVLQAAFIIVFIIISSLTDVSDSARMLMKLLLSGTQIMSFLFLLYILLIWRRGLERGQKPWILQHKFNYKEIILLWIVATVMVNIVFNAFNALIEHSQNSTLLYIQNPSQTTKDIEVIMRYLKAGSGVILNFALLWWIDWPSRGIQSLFKGIGFIILLLMFLLSIGFLQMLLFSEPGKAKEMLALNARTNGIPLAAGIGVYLIYFTYRCILDRKLERIV